MSQKELLRILDANFNRSREGLRVCEEIARFVMNDANATREIKKARHAVTDCLKKFPISMAALVLARDSEEDVGKKPSALEKGRQNALGLFLANIERAKEALRVLEETSKLLDTKSSPRFKKIRFQVYTIEKKITQKLEALYHHRP